MISPEDSRHESRKRTNDEWIGALIGCLGADEQQQAHTELARYLYVVAYNDLLHQSAHIAMLRHQAREELAALAQDFVQDVLEKLAQKHFARLHQFRGEGRFVAWAAQVMHRQIISELRRRCWHQQELLAEEEFMATAADCSDSPEGALERAYVQEVLASALVQLPERQRIAFIRRIIDHECTEQVAAELETTTNAVNVLLFRARQRVQKELINMGLAPRG